MAATPPPPPHNEEDLAVPKGWSDDEDDEDLGKRSEEYPPVNEDETETRRIEENLKRWEVAERMKRKTARESKLSEPQASTLLSEVSRRASLLWTTTRTSPSQRNMNPSLGTHAALNSEDSVDVVPLDEIAATPTPSPTVTDQNPFANPESSPASPSTANPFIDPEAGTIMSPTEVPVEMDDSTATLTVPSTPTRPALLTASSSYRRPPTPKPLGLPPPRAPPPLAPETAPPPPPLPEPIHEEEEEEPQPTRWWHEWLCGLGEGDDRGGDHQAGRTNPFE
ncbi:hypothetical protein FB45DRAFT_975115 [Roridomyces roridus]|uniref:Uncharacterized protein n=1 Tax=Roridomyces roridus TaxID=1738132 RepID=A0AAD7CHK2_9AGAR|nr:hypothetical protein FB45DRAFT_975115 [Roridomyces roridus]